jgi:ferredoxin-NADP reductase
MEVNMSNGVNSQTPKPEENTAIEKALGFLSRQLTNTDSFGVYLEPIIQLFKPEWRHNHISAKVIMMKNETDNTYTLTLKPANKWKNFYAGQFVQLSVEIEGAMLSRTFSVSCAPQHYLNTGEITLTIRSHEDGAVTPWINKSLRSGDYVYLSQAQGDFQLSNSSKDKVFIAGGSGLTPLYSILSENQDKAWFQNTQLLFYINNPQALFFAEKLSHLQSKGLELTTIYSDDQGFISQDHLSQFVADIDKKEFYVCGPGTMIETTRSLLEENNVPTDDIHYEYFGTQPVSLEGLDCDSSEAIQVDYLDSKKQVTFDPEEFLESSSTTLLEISEQQGLKPVTGCRIGVCHQCICKKKTGRVFNTRTQQYSDSGAEEIQLCVSVPVGKVELEL